MAVTKAKKDEVLKRVEGAVDEAGSMVFVGFKGLSVADVTELRKKLKEEGVTYYVAKKTLVRRALSGKTIDGSQPEFPGELAIAWGDDMIAPARGVYDFAKAHKGAVSILGGVFEGRYMDADEMTGVATIPSRHTLYAMFVNVINSPIQKLAVAVDQIAQKREA